MDVITAAQMEQINNALIILAVAVIGGVGTIAAALFATYKWYIPKRFELQTKEREMQLKALEDKIVHRAAAADVDIERDRMLPQLINSINSFAASNIQQTQMFGAILQDRATQDARTASEMHAHTLAITDVSTGLGELREEFSEIRQQIETMVINVQHNTTASSAAENASKRTLELVQAFDNRLTEIAHAAKHGDTKPIAPINVSDEPKADGEAA